jgi:hypothetical protein
MAESTEGPDEVSEAAREHLPDEVEKACEARARAPDWPASGREFEAIMFGRGVFFTGTSIHSIVIVTPPHASKFYQRFKKLTAFGCAQNSSKPAVRLEII